MHCLGNEAEIDGVTPAVRPIAALLFLATVCAVITTLPCVLPHT